MKITNTETNLTGRISRGVDTASEYFAHRKGLLPLLGVSLLIINFLLVSFLPADWYIVRTNLFLHLGLIVAILGQMLAWVL